MNTSTEDNWNPVLIVLRIVRRVLQQQNEDALFDELLPT